MRQATEPIGRIVRVICTRHKIRRRKRFIPRQTGPLTEGIIRDRDVFWAHNIPAVALLFDIGQPANCKLIRSAIHPDHKLPSTPQIELDCCGHNVKAKGHDQRNQGPGCTKFRTHTCLYNR